MPCVIVTALRQHLIAAAREEILQCSMSSFIRLQIENANVIKNYAFAIDFNLALIRYHLYSVISIHSIYYIFNILS